MDLDTFLDDLRSRERIEAELLAELDALLEQHGRKLT